MSKDDTKPKVKGLLAELYSNGDVKEGLLSVKELVDANADMAVVVEQALTVSLETKGTNWDNLRDLLTQAGEENIIGQEQFHAGARQLLNALDDITVDVPKAPAQVGEVLAALVASKAVDLKVIGQHILEADPEDDESPEGEDTLLVSGGRAAELLGALLSKLRDATSAEDAAAAWAATGLKYEDYFPQEDRSDEVVLTQFVQDYDLSQVISA